MLSSRQLKKAIKIYPKLTGYFFLSNRLSDDCIDDKVKKESTRVRVPTLSNYSKEQAMSEILFDNFQLQYYSKYGHEFYIDDEGEVYLNSHGYAFVANIPVSWVDCRLEDTFPIYEFRFGSISERLITEEMALEWLTKLDKPDYLLIYNDSYLSTVSC